MYDQIKSDLSFPNQHMQICTSVKRDSKPFSKQRRNKFNTI
jgi:hypothetical protein